MSTLKLAVGRLVELGFADDFCDATVICVQNGVLEEVRISKLLLVTACPNLQMHLAQRSSIKLPVSSTALRAVVIQACGLELEDFGIQLEQNAVQMAAAILNAPQEISATRELEASGRLLASSEWRSWAAVLLSMVTLAAWMPATCFTMGSFFMDDSMIARNPNVYAALDIRRLLRSDYWGLDMFAGTWTHKSFRPLTVLTFRWNYLLHGFDSVGFHLTNLGLHLICSGLLGVLGFTVGLTKHNAVFLALLFCAHPVHTESVLYIVGRADLLCLFFVLLSALTHRFSSRTGRGFKEGYIVMLGSSLSCGLLLVAGLCKETGFCFFGLLVGWDMLQLLGRLQRQAWFRLRIGLVLVAGVVSCACRIWYTGTTIERMDPHSNPVAAENDATIRMLSYALVHGIYGKLLVWPMFLCYDYSYDAVPLVRHPFDVRLLLSLAAYSSFAQGLTLAVGIFRSSSVQEASSQVPLLGLAIIFLSFLPMSNILFPVGTMVAERLLYIPSAGFLLSSLGFVQRRFSGTWLPLVAIGIIYTHLTAKRVRDWSSPESITVADAAKQQRSVRVQYNLASYYLSEQRYDEALTSFRRVMELDPTGRDCMPLYRSGQILFYQGNHTAAEQLLARAVEGHFSPLILNEEEVFHDYALALWFVQKPQHALVNFEKSLAINSSFTKGLNNLGCALGLGALLGQLPSQAIEYGLEQLQQAVELSPSSVLYWRNLVALRRFAGQEAVAESAWEQVLALDPDGIPPEDCSWEFAIR